MGRRCSGEVGSGISCRKVLVDYHGKLAMTGKCDKNVVVFIQG